jgi:hypothetical protein
MKRLVLVGVCIALAACSRKDGKGTGASASASASAATAATTAAASAPAASASAASEATVAPFDDGDETLVPAAKLKDDAERDKKGAAALAGVKLDEKADLSVAPKDGVYANILGHLTTLDDIKLSAWGGKWSLEAKMGGKVSLGPSVSFTEEQIGKKKFGKALKYGDGYFQMPKKEEAKKWPLTEFKQTTSMNSDNAFNVEITKFQPGTFASPGKCSGRFSLYYDLKSDPKGPLWATGTFKNVKCYRSK